MSDSGRGISTHFRREAIIMVGFFVAIFVIGILVAVLAPRLLGR